MRLKGILHLTRCWTGRLWVNIGRGLFAIGFGPHAAVERVYLGRKLRYAWRP